MTQSRTTDARVWALTFEHSPVGMAVVGLDGRWSQVNQSLCEMVGYPAERLMTMTFQDITHPDDLEHDLHLLHECLDGSRTGYRMVKRYLHADGRRVWGDLSVALVRDEVGEPVHFISQILDISEQVADRERLEEATRALSSANDDLEQFAAVVSHDLKTPLTSVRAALELLTDGIGPDPTADLALVRHMAERAGAASERMAALIDALLAYATTDARTREGRVGAPTTAERTVLAEVATQALADVEVMVHSSGSVVTLEPSLLDAPDVAVAPALVRTMLVNLVSNAVKHRDPARPLRVALSAGAAADHVLVTVANDGPPIPAEERERVFGMFARMSAPIGGETDGVAGFGIGLAACRRIVGWHGGQIWMAEPETGSGVAVSFTLPRAAGA